ncbi:MAG: CRISPR-associated endonuclease Cas2 [Saprospiraceae bacterium]|nr:CRISPR-associated endonuclease Cas2 [Saprospiraceae bacterium]
MHYIICYDIENDRLREKTAKALARHGCSRVQKSVFVAPALPKKHLLRLQADLQRLLAGHLAPGDSVLLVPLGAEESAQILCFGENNILPCLEKKPLKIIL